MKTGSNQVSNIRKEKVRPNPIYLQKYDALKNWRKKKGVELSVESDVVLPKEHMDLIAHQKDCALTDIQKIMHDIPYRFRKFGNEILAVMEGIE